MPNTTILPTAQRPPSAFAVSAKVAFVQFDGTVKDFIRSQCQMMADDHTDFTVEQCCRIRMKAQNISSRTGGNFVYKKFEQFLLYSLT